MPYNPFRILKNRLVEMKKDYPNEVSFEIIKNLVIEEIGISNPKKQKLYVKTLIELGYIKEIRPFVFVIMV